MKKLLAILGSISMVSSLTTLVVACGGNSTKTKQDLTIFDLSLGAFDDIPEDQIILDAFNIKSSLNLNLVLNTDVTIEDKTNTGATIISNPDSILCSGSTKVKFTIKINLNNYDKKEFTIDKKEPNENDILTMFNNENNIDLLLGTDVTIKVNNENKQATITAMSGSEKVKGEVKVIFSKKIFFKNMEWGGFTHLNGDPNIVKLTEQEVLQIINNDNRNKIGDDLKLEHDLWIDWPTKTGTTIKALETSKYLVAGTWPIEFTYKPKLQDFKEKEIKTKFPKRPSSQEVLDQFNIINSLTDEKKKLILDTDVTIVQDTITDNSAIIKDISSSQKVQGEVEISFELKIDLSQYNIELSIFDTEPNLDDVFKKFRDESKLTKLTSEDVKVIIKENKQEAIIEALNKSLDYTGVANVTFSTKRNINSILEEENLGFVKDRRNETLFAKIKEKNISGDDTIWKQIESNIDLKKLAKSFTKNNFEITMKKNDLYIGTKTFTFDISLPDNLDDNETVYLDEEWRVQRTTEFIPKERQIIQILQIGYDKNGLAHQAPKTIKYVPNIISEKITSIANLFYFCKDFNDSAVSNWNTLGITSMHSTFHSAESFNQNISKWWALTVKDMSAMFSYAYEFNNGEKPLIWEQNSHNVTDMSQMFYATKHFNQDISSWNLDKVTDMTMMFGFTKAFNNNNKPLNWNTKNITSMHQMFLNSEKFEQNISSWNVDNVTRHDRFATDSLLEKFPSYLPIWKH